MKVYCKPRDEHIDVKYDDCDRDEIGSRSESGLPPGRASGKYICRYDGERSAEFLNRDDILLSTRD
jgi:hypothetical protein